MGSLTRNATAPLVEEVTGVQPWHACRRFADLPHLLYFDSALGTPLGRYSFLSADPFAWLTARRASSDPFAALAQRLAPFRLETLDGLPPFQGGAAGLDDPPDTRKFVVDFAGRGCEG